MRIIKVAVINRSIVRSSFLLGAFCRRRPVVRQVFSSSRRKYDLLQFPFRTHNDLHIMFEQIDACTGSLYNDTALRLISAFCMITRLLACGSQLSYFYKTLTMLLFSRETAGIFFLQFYKTVSECHTSCILRWNCRLMSKIDCVSRKFLSFITCRRDLEMVKIAVLIEESEMM